MGTFISENVQRVAYVAKTGAVRATKPVRLTVCNSHFTATPATETYEYVKFIRLRVHMLDLSVIGETSPVDLVRNWYSSVDTFRSSKQAYRLVCRVCCTIMTAQLTYR